MTIKKGQNVFVTRENTKIQNTPTSGRVHAIGDKHVVIRTVGGTGLYKVPKEHISTERKDSWLAKKYSGIVKESFLKKIFGKKDTRPAVEHPKERFPNSNKANEWMSQKVAHYERHKPNELHHLFSPASGDYMPTDVHVGSSWKKEHEAHYNELKKKHPEAVAKAKEMTTGIAGRVSLSRVGPNADFHGMSIHEDAPANAVGGGNIAGMGVGPKGEPGVSPKAMKRYKAKNAAEAPKAGRKSFKMFMLGK